MIKRFKPSIKEIAPLIEIAINSGKDAKLTVTGYSMYPIFRSGSDDVVLTAPKDIKKYDVVLYKRTNGDYIFHRIIKISGDTLTIAGDNEVKKEYPIYKNQVIAKMKGFIRNGKEYPSTALWYRLYSKIWLMIFPLRHIAARILHNSARIFRKLKKRSR